ncbi:MAG TPA: glycosyltransferase [Chthoniobacterales bacterium]|jgi:GT2 family glycosyltransferase
MHPTFSVVIPTRDRFPQLAVCLEALAVQDFPREKFEVIVVNDGSRSPVPVSINSFQDRLNLTIANRAESNGPSVARNCGGKTARGEFLAFTDDDCTPAPDWLSRLADRLVASPNQLIGGRVINALTRNSYSTAAHVILDVVYQHYDPARDRAHFFPTSNIALAAENFREMAGFDEAWPLAAAEDREFCYRWLKRGWEMAYAPEAIVYHHHALSLRSFCSLHFKYGRGAYHYHQLRAGGPGQGGLKPDWKFYWACVRYPFAHFGIGRAAGAAALMLLWQGANAAGYFWQRFVADEQNGP